MVAGDVQSTGMVRVCGGGRGRRVGVLGVLRGKSLLVRPGWSLPNRGVAVNGDILRKEGRDQLRLGSKRRCCQRCTAPSPRSSPHSSERDPGPFPQPDGPYLGRGHRGQRGQTYLRILINPRGNFARRHRRVGSRARRSRPPITSAVRRDGVVALMRIDRRSRKPGRASGTHVVPVPITVVFTEKAVKLLVEAPAGARLRPLAARRRHARDGRPSLVVEVIDVDIVGTAGASVDRSSQRRQLRWSLGRQITVQRHRRRGGRHGARAAAAAATGATARHPGTRNDRDGDVRRGLTVSLVRHRRLVRHRGIGSRGIGSRGLRTSGDTRLTLAR